MYPEPGKGKWGFSAPFNSLIYANYVFEIWVIANQITHCLLWILWYKRLLHSFTVCWTSAKTLLCQHAEAQQDFLSVFRGLEDLKVQVISFVLKKKKKKSNFVRYMQNKKIKVPGLKKVIFHSCLFSIIQQLRPLCRQNFPLRVWMLICFNTKEPSSLCLLNFSLDYSSVMNLLSHDRINCIKSTGSMLSDYIIIAISFC